MELSVAFAEINFELVPALDLNANGRRKVVNFCRDERGSRQAGAAGQGFAFHSAFVSANSDVVATEDLDKVYVGSLRREVRVPPNFLSEGHNHSLVGIRHKQDGVRHARIYRVQ